VCALAEAANELGGMLRIVGLAKRPGYILIQSHSPTLKFIMLQEVVEYEVKIGRIREDDLMIFVDGHDVFLQRPLAELVEAYEQWPGSPYLISGEKNCWPWPHSHPSHGDFDPGLIVPANTTWDVHDWMQVRPEDFCRMIPQRGPYRYPNIGTSMGPVSKFLEVLRRNNKIVLDEDMNDQGAMWLVILRHAKELNMQIDQNGTVFVNMLQYKPGDFEREPCTPDWFKAVEGGHDRYGRERAPPKNTLTNRTPALVHFNGPSHEDDVWLTCYHAFSREFRAAGKGHMFFDVDHNMAVSTDMLCDYSWYHVDSYHAHPINSQTLGFMEEFYALPVDPGLVAFRGESSADVSRFGKEEDLHKESPLLTKVLHSKS